MTERRPVGQELSFKNVRLLRREKLGQGSYGTVCKAQCDQLICAAKVIYDVLRETVTSDPGKEHRQPHSRFLSEIELLKRLHHPNIVQYLGTYEDPDSGDLVLLMELMDESLTHFLESSPEDIPYRTQVSLSNDIAQALAFLHTNGIIHRDLSSNNVLLLAGTRAKVTDFGMYKFTEGIASMTLSPGTPAFMPPEALNQSPVYTEKLDNFSFGVLLVQIVTRQFPEPTDRFEKVRIPNPRDLQNTIEAKIDVPEVERRRGHISLIQQDHPLLPIALDCLKDRDQERPSSQDLCERLNTLKGSEFNSQRESSQQDPGGTTIEQLQTQIQQQKFELREKTRLIQSKDQQIDTQQMYIQEQQEELARKEEQLRDMNENFEQVTAALQEELMQLRARRANDREIPTKQTTKAPINIRWGKLPDSPFQISAGSTAVIGDDVFVSNSDSIQQLSLSQKTWNKVPIAPVAKFTIVNVENMLTTVGGRVNGLLTYKFTNKLYSYKDSKWVEVLPPMLTRCLTPGAVYTKNTLVVAGGYTYVENSLSTVEILNTASKQWSSVSSLPFRVNQPSICAHGDFIYIHPIFSHTSEQYTLSRCSLAELIESESWSGIWERKAPLPVSGTMLASVNGHLMAVGGMDSKLLPTNNVFQYNETTDSWADVSRMSVSRSECLTALLPENKLMVLGGKNKVQKLGTIDIANIV